jgi:hypothetical protein
MSKSWDVICEQTDGVEANRHFLHLFVVNMPVKDINIVICPWKMSQASKNIK